VPLRRQPQRRTGAGAAPLGTADLETALGYRFREPGRLEEALTHSSMSGARGKRVRTYERLEFLGDRVLGLIVAHLLIERFPEDAEGALTQRQVAMVRRESLAAVAAGLDLGRWVRTSPSEAGAAAKRRPGMLADCCEAVIGAIYLDGGFSAAQDFVTRHWTPLIETVQTPPRDAKMALQEWAHSQALEPPAYNVVATMGPAHATTFTVEVTLAGRPSQLASAATKRAAERAAAAMMLERIAFDDVARA
jgi:ribonuclease III